MLNIKINENISNDNKVEKKAKINKIINDKKGDNYEKLIYLAMLAEQASKYDDMVEFMKKVASERTGDFNSDEKSLMSVAFKNFISVNRQVNKTIKTYENKEKKKNNSPYLSYILEYKKLILDEFIEQCQNIINFIEKICLPKAKENESKGFYLKMLGDYNRYIGEYVEGSLKNKIIDSCNKYYSEADKILKNFPYINPIKLGLLLNTTNFYYDIMEDPQKAIKLSEIAVKKFEVEKAKNNIDKESDEFKDSQKIYELIKENLDLWKAKK